MEQVMIREPRMEEYEVVEQLMKQVQKLHIQWRPDIYKECEYVISYDEFLECLRDGTIFVAECKGTVAGVLSYTVRHVDLTHMAKRQVLFIDAIVVEEKFRRHGIATALLEHAKQLKEKHHYDGLELQVNACNADALEMYKNAGFTYKSINMELL